MTGNYIQIGQKNPCVGCPAPCCNLHLMGSKSVENYMDLDWLRYSLGFDDYELLLNMDGSLNLVRWARCGHYDPQGMRCKVYRTPEQPHTCAYYNPWNCWYKRNFTSPESHDVIRLNAERFETFLAEVMLDDNRRIVSRPTFERVRGLVSGIPLEPRWCTHRELREAQS